MMTTNLVSRFTKFQAVFGEKADHFLFHQVGLIRSGEHTDCNVGHVSPSSYHTRHHGAARKREDEVLCFFSGNLFNTRGSQWLHWKSPLWKRAITDHNYLKRRAPFARSVIDSGMMSMFTVIFRRDLLVFFFSIVGALWLASSLRNYMIFISRPSRLHKIGVPNRKSLHRSQLRDHGPICHRGVYLTGYLTT